MLLEAALFVAGLAALVYGADRAVSAAAGLGLHYGVSTFFVGVTVVSIGTSVPEVVTAVYGAFYGAGDLVVGNVVGSEVAQTTLAVGLVALVAPIAATRRDVAVHGGGVVLAMVVMVLALEDAAVLRPEGVLMLLAYAVLVRELYAGTGGGEIAEHAVEPRSPRETVPWLVAGLALVVVGGQVMVTNGVAVALLLGVPEYLVGLLTGLATTLPEMAVATVAAREGDVGISAGAILGSNVTDPLFSLGVGALVAPVVVTDLPTVQASLAYMLAVTLVVLGLFYWRRGIDRRVAVLCLVLYVPSYLVL